MTAAVLRTHGLIKRYGAVLAVDGVDLCVQEGDTYGFLGPNGSGKTTLVRMVLGLVHATAGEIELLGHPVPTRVGRALPDVGALVEGPAAYGHLSGRRNLALFDAAGPGGSRRGRAGRIDDALHRVGLDGVDRRPVRAYSLGMRQRLGLAAALLRRPRLLVLDEPTNGLDPRGIQELRALIGELNAEGVTIFLSSHLLAEVEACCNRVGILDRGRLLREDTLARLLAPTGRVILETSEPATARAALDGAVVAQHGTRLVVGAGDPATITARLVHAGVPVTAIHAERPRLEDVVLSLVGAGTDQVAGPQAGVAR